MAVLHISFYLPIRTFEAPKNSPIPFLDSPPKSHRDDALNWALSVFTRHHSHPLFSPASHQNPTKNSFCFHGFIESYQENGGDNACSDKDKLRVQEFDGYIHRAENRPLNVPLIEPFAISSSMLERVENVAIRLELRMWQLD